MKTNTFPKLIVGVAAMFLLLAACDKKAEKVAKADDLASIGGGVSAFACTVKDTVVKGSGTNFFAYALWTPTVVSFQAGLGAQWEGFANSFFRPVTNTGWFVGAIPKADSCGTWTDIRTKIRPHNQNKGTSPDTTTTTPSGPVNFTYTPYNVVGVSGSYFNKLYGSGYYSYSSPVPSFDSVIVAWKDSGPTWPTGNSTPSGLLAPDAYVISVHKISVNPATLADTIWYSYRKL